MSGKLYLVSPNSAESGTLETLPVTANLVHLKEEDVNEASFNFKKEDKVCVTSEASLDIVRKKIEDKAKIKGIDCLKDKYQFREILSELYPGYRFEKIDFKGIEDLKIEKQTVLKPLKGCFGTAVKIIDQHSDLKKVSEEVALEIEKNSSVLSENVLSKNEFIVEDFIKGEEYAVDMFYDEKGKPHIVNIYHHPMPKIAAYLHMIYYTSKEVFDKVYDQANAFFEKLNLILNVKNLAIHSEFKLDKELFPIELNTMRFGGMGLGNMIYHSVGVNPYDCFIKGESPDWNTIWQKNEDSIFAFLIAYNGTDVNKLNQEPDIEKLKNRFTKLLKETLFDYKEQLAFGVFCIEETKSNLEKLLEIDFNDYFKSINS
ncbi:ATP-grasp domain-containing protein [Aquimarina agarilytica]|uniref:ATP-grasp domain-containing protein n=1 Tax=Aquimarina agarilytica TaxID=1087449 RepID=UPI000288CFB9|nr:ATP-grasp domain-containing protein [Aquimarina agarilytica]